jgi:hypothetical protein
MDVWVVAGYMGQVYGVYTTEKRAATRKEELERDGVKTTDPIHTTVNKGDWKNGDAIL